MNSEKQITVCQYCQSTLNGTLPLPGTVAHYINYKFSAKAELVARGINTKNNSLMQHSVKVKAFFIHTKKQLQPSDTKILTNCLVRNRKHIKLIIYICLLH